MVRRETAIYLKTRKKKLRQTHKNVKILMVIAFYVHILYIVYNVYIYYKDLRWTTKNNFCSLTLSISEAQPPFQIPNGLSFFTVHTRTLTHTLNFLIFLREATNGEDKLLISNYSNSNLIAPQISKRL